MYLVYIGLFVLRWFKGVLRAFLFHGVWIWASWQNEFKGVYFAPERRLDLLWRWSYHCFGFFDFSKLSFLFKIFWVAILKSERFFSWVNRWSGKDFGSSIDVLHKALKIAHTYTFFDEKFLWIWDSLSHYDFVIFLVFYMRIMQSENFATNIHTHYRQSETAPQYTRIICEKNFAPYIWELRCGWNLWAIDWALASWRSFVSCFVYAVIVWIRSFLLIGRCQNSL